MIRTLIKNTRMKVEFDAMESTAEVRRGGAEVRRGGAEVRKGKLSLT